MGRKIFCCCRHQSPAARLTRQPVDQISESRRCPSSLPAWTRLADTVVAPAVGRVAHPDGPPRRCYNPAEMAALLGSLATRPESCLSTRYNSHRDYPEWRLVTNLLERGVARPLAAVRFPVVTKAPSDTLISTREEHEASSGRKGERGAALEYPRGGLPVLPL
jgi:hypothetical protein